MVRMSDIWDRASAVIGDRLGLFTSIALLFVWLPGLVRTAAGVAVQGPAGTPVAAPSAALAGGALVVALLGLAAVVLGIIGHLALVAVASDVVVGRDAAVRIGWRRFWPYVGIMALVVAVLLIMTLPLLIALAGAYPSIAVMQAGVPPQVGPGTGLFVLLYSLVLAVVIIWVEARLLVITPVLVNERLGLRSIARAWALTRGLTWRIVGVLLLFAVVALVAVLAVKGVVGVTLRLLLGASQAGLALFLTSAAVSLVGCVISVVAAAFTAQLYLATAEGRSRA